jgi:O-acetyl-ADP-ribose deacetylase (regulator of RNase III)
VWHGGFSDEPALLASCYKKSLALAKENKIKTLAFPGISTGVYRFPKDLAALIAVNETKKFLEKNIYPEKVIFVTYGDDNYETYRKILNP